MIEMAVRSYATEIIVRPARSLLGPLFGNHGRLGLCAVSFVIGSIALAKVVRGVGSRVRIGVGSRVSRWGRYVVSEGHVVPLSRTVGTPSDGFIMMVSNLH